MDCYCTYKNLHACGEGLEQRKGVCEKFLKDGSAFIKGDHDKNVYRECDDIKKGKDHGLEVIGRWLMLLHLKS